MCKSITKKTFTLNLRLPPPNTAFFQPVDAGLVNV